jgi:hypothetical protein
MSKLSPWTLKVLEKLRAAALQQLQHQQSPDVAKRRVLHTRLLQVSSHMSFKRH